MIDFNMIPSPCYVMEEELLRRKFVTDQEREGEGGS